MCSWKPFSNAVIRQAYGRACRPRRGGSPWSFCTSACRMAFYAAARRWAELAVALGMLTIAELRNGDQGACMLTVA